MIFRSEVERRAFTLKVHQAHLSSEDAERDVLARLIYPKWLREVELAECKAFDARIAALRREALALRVEILMRKYRPDQPRVPAGHPSGGQWTSGGGEGGNEAGGAPGAFDFGSIFSGAGGADGESGSFAEGRFRQ